MFNFLCLIPWLVVIVGVYGGYKLCPKTLELEESGWPKLAISITIGYSVIALAVLIFSVLVAAVLSSPVIIDSIFDKIAVKLFWAM